MNCKASSNLFTSLSSSGDFFRVASLPPRKADYNNSHSSCFGTLRKPSPFLPLLVLLAICADQKEKQKEKEKQNTLDSQYECGEKATPPWELTLQRIPKTHPSSAPHGTIVNATAGSVTFRRLRLDTDGTRTL